MLRLRQRGFRGPGFFTGATRDQTPEFLFPVDCMVAGDSYRTLWSGVASRRDLVFRGLAIAAR